MFGGTCYQSVTSIVTSNDFYKHCVAIIERCASPAKKKQRPTHAQFSTPALGGLDRHHTDGVERSVLGAYLAVFFLPEAAHADKGDAPSD